MKQSRRAQPAPPKLSIRHDYLPRAIAAFLVLAAAILFAFFLTHASGIGDFFNTLMTALGPVLTGLLFAYLLNPITEFFERHTAKTFRRIFHKPEQAKRAARSVCAVFTVLLAVCVISLLCVIIVPEVALSVSKLVQELPGQIENFSENAKAYVQNNPKLGAALSQAITYVADPLEEWASEGVLSNADVWVGYLASGIMGMFTLTYNILIGLIIAVYLLIGKERFLRQGSKVLYATMKPHRADWIIHRMQGANNTFSSAILGKALDSTIIGMLTFIGAVILQVPYTALIAVIIGITNMIPFFGPFIGGIPSVLLVLMHDPWKALYFGIFILVLQQFDCNFLDPKIVGASIGLPAFWSIFACLLGGGLFGIFGMLIGVPLFAVAYNLAKELIEERLRRKALSPEVMLRLRLSPELDPNDTFFGEEDAMPDGSDADPLPESQEETLLAGSGKGDA